MAAADGHRWEGTKIMPVGNSMLQQELKNV
jgi:hypothetical protein